MTVEEELFPPEPETAERRPQEVTPRASITLPIEATTLVQHVTSHASRLALHDHEIRKLKDSGRSAAKALDVVLARAMLKIKEELREQVQTDLAAIKATLEGQDKVLLQIKGAGKLIALVFAIATFLGAVSEIISLVNAHH